MASELGRLVEKLDLARFAVYQPSTPRKAPDTEQFLRDAPDSSRHLHSAREGFLEEIEKEFYFLPGLLVTPPRAMHSMFLRSCRKASPLAGWWDARVNLDRCLGSR
ncbi:hypothetical protein NM688_g7394 [Phlebia brevispora]|uniref:Uncharacterized protein n=1 Tax=Phlebia brevispora TaxID=194682 RepID=A0ACC1S5M0_9APHY|nr:hypothetical protein NM688_g7394 [Phlebia brevispora]